MNETVPVWFVMSSCTVACVIAPAIAASTAFPPLFNTSIIVCVTMGCWLLATAFIPRTTRLSP
jgi:hypothetical protein